MSLPEINKIYQGDVLEVLRTWPGNFVQTVVTSPPYWCLRSYLPDGVKLRSDLTAEEYFRVIDELEKLGIHPIEV